MSAVLLQREDLGTIEAGKIVDLVLLDKNPLEDIRNTRTIRALLRNGVLLATRYDARPQTFEALFACRTAHAAAGATGI